MLIERSGYTPFGTFGKLTYKDFTCLTVERPWENNKPMVSCIPEGEYTVSWYDAPRFGMVLSVVGGTVSLFPNNIQTRSAILIHPANVMTELEGCIGVGDTFGCLWNMPAVYNSVATLNKLLQTLKNDNFTSDTLTITSLKNQGVLA